MKNIVTIQAQDQMIPVFAPIAILADVTQVLSSSGYLAIRSDTDFTYQINGVGPSITNVAGAILGVNPKITSIDFGATVGFLEVM
jgi:hypothetical protein